MEESEFERKSIKELRAEADRLLGKLERIRKSKTERLVKRIILLLVSNGALVGGVYLCHMWFDVVWWKTIVLYGLFFFSNNLDR